MRLLPLLFLALPVQAEDLRFEAAPIYGRVMAFPLPAAFALAYEGENGASRLRELTRDGESVEAWTQLITMTGFKGGAGQMALDRYASAFVNGYAQNCPETFGVLQVNWPGQAPIPGAEAQVGLWMGCGTVAGISEQVAVIFAASGSDIFTLQWAERGAPGPKLTEPDWAIWDPRFELLYQARFCAGDSDPAACVP